MSLATSDVRTRPDDFVSLAERTWVLAGLRLCIYAAVVATLVVRPVDRPTDVTSAIGMMLASTLVTGATVFVGRLSRRRAVQLTAASILADGVFLGWVVYLTGGVASPLWWAVYVHVVGVSLLGSFRTGLKLAVWHSLVRLAVVYAEASGLLAVLDPPRVLPRIGAVLPFGALGGLGVMWAIFAATAALAGVNERELRAHRFRLEALSKLVRRFEAAHATDEIPPLLLDSLRSVFDVRRGAILAEGDGDLVVLAAHEVAEVDAVPRGADEIVESAWSVRHPLLVRRLDPERDRRLASMLPGASNLIVVPLAAERRGRAGVVVLERGGRVGGLPSSSVSMLQEYCSHAWLAMNNGWLLDDIRDALEENRALQDKLREQNESLEHTVEERTAEVTERLKQLRLVDDARRALLDKLVSAQEEERARLAGDIHDDPIQKMVVTSMRLQMLRRQVTDPEVTEGLEALLETVKTSIASMRHLIFELRPTVLDEDGLAAALRSLLDSVSAHLTYDLDNELADEPSPENRVILYRIAQEAIGNVRKHARVDHVSVAMGQRKGGHFVRVSDDGVGFAGSEIPQSAPGHLGLTSMRERAELAGGWCKVQSLPGSGTVVEAWIPERKPVEPDGEATLQVADPGAGTTPEAVVSLPAG